MPIIVRKLPNENYYRGFNDKTKIIRRSLGKGVGGMIGDARVSQTTDATGVRNNLNDDERRENIRVLWREYQIQDRAFRQDTSLKDSSDYIVFEMEQKSRLDGIRKLLKQLDPNIPRAINSNPGLIAMLQDTFEPIPI